MISSPAAIRWRNLSPKVFLLAVGESLKAVLGVKLPKSSGKISVMVSERTGIAFRSIEAKIRRYILMSMPLSAVTSAAFQPRIFF